MQTSHHAATARRSTTTWYVLATALVALGGLTLLALQRGALGSLGAAPSWAWPSLATGTAVGAVALGWLALTRFAREAEQQPYVWTAPLLVIFCFAPLSQISAKLPLPSVTLSGYLLGAGLLIVGGGAFGRVPTASARTLGAVLTLTPTLLLVLGHVLQSGTPRGALSQVDGPGLWLLGMTLFAGLGVLAIATVARSLEQVTAHGRANLAAADAARLDELVQHAQEQWHVCQVELARLAEERQLFEAWMHDQRAQRVSQQQVQLQARSEVHAPLTSTVPPPRRAREQTEPGVRARPPSDDTQQFMALARPGLGWPTKLGLIVAALACIGLGVYDGWYKPERARQVAQARAAQEAAAAEAAGVAALRAKLAEEQTRAAQALEEERKKAEAARVEAERVAAAAAAQQQADAEAAAAAEATKAAELAKASASKRAKKRAAAKGAKRSSARAVASREDDPIAGLDGI